MDIASHAELKSSFKCQFRSAKPESKMEGAPCLFRRLDKHFALTQTTFIGVPEFCQCCLAHGPEKISQSVTCTTLGSSISSTPPAMQLCYDHHIPSAKSHACKINPTRHKHCTSCDVEPAASTSVDHENQGPVFPASSLFFGKL